MKVAALRIGGNPEQWSELGFHVQPSGDVALGGVRIELRPAAAPGAIESWALEGTRVPGSVDGLLTHAGNREVTEPDHPNGALSIDHVVVLTTSLERTSTAFANIGVDRRRVRDAGGGVRQGFFLVGDLLVEVVEGMGPEEGKPARFWGITVVVSDIDRAAEVLGERLGRVKDAVQPGRRIATVRAEASGGLPLALITQRERPAG